MGHRHIVPVLVSTLGLKSLSKFGICKLPSDDFTILSGSCRTVCSPTCFLLEICRVSWPPVEKPSGHDEIGPWAVSEIFFERIGRKAQSHFVQNACNVLRNVVQMVQLIFLNSALGSEALLAFSPPSM